MSVFAPPRKAEGAKNKKKQKNKEEKRLDKLFINPLCPNFRPCGLPRGSKNSIYIGGGGGGGGGEDEKR